MQIITNVFLLLLHYNYEKTTRINRSASILTTTAAKTGYDVMEKMAFVISNSEEGILNLKVCGFRICRNCSNKLKP
jgi:hypothetical protein